VTQEDSVRAAIDTAVRHYGGLHILHNNAGGSTPRDNTVVEAPIDEFWRAIRLDLFGTFLGCRFGIPAIIASGGGSVINMASNVALMGIAGRDCYTAAKGGVAAITRSMAVEFAPQRVRVNAIAPSATMTDRVRGRLEAGNSRVTKLAAAHLLGMIDGLAASCSFCRRELSSLRKISDALNRDTLYNDPATVTVRMSALRLRAAIRPSMPSFFRMAANSERRVATPLIAPSR